MIQILFAILGGLLISTSLEIRIRRRPRLLAGWLSVVVGTALLIEAYISLGSDAPLWLQASTVAGMVIAMLLGSHFSTRLATKGKS